MQMSGLKTPTLAVWWERWKHCKDISTLEGHDLDPGLDTEYGPPTGENSVFHFVR